MPGAVFLSYASQDAEAARRICEALRAAGIEVWFDQSELRGGDAWDAKIRRQIKECALFVPVISANTQVRLEGYFRLEWRLAEQRTHLMGRNKAFLVPVCIDETRDVDADVPDGFLTIQWTRLPGGEPIPAFGQRIQTLLSAESVDTAPSGRPSAAAAEPVRTVWPLVMRLQWRRWLAPAIALVAAIVAVLVWLGHRSTQPAAAPQLASTAAIPPEAADLIAKTRKLYDNLNYGRADLELAEQFMASATDLAPASAEAWGLRGYVQATYVQRTWDYSDNRIRDAQSYCSKALALDPKNTEAMLGLGYIWDYQGVFDQAEALMRQAIPLRPDDPRLHRLLGWLLCDSGHVPEGIKILEDTVHQFPRDPLSWYDLGYEYTMHGKDTEGLEAFKHVVVLAPVTIAYLRIAVELLNNGDMDGAEAAFNRIPLESRTGDRAVSVEMWLGLLEHKPERAIAAGKLTAGDYFDDGYLRGPKALLTALAYRMAGKNTLANQQWDQAAEVLRRRLQNKPKDLDRVLLAVALAWKGNTAEAAAVAAPIEAAQRESLDPSLIIPLAHYYAAQGDASKTVACIKDAPWILNARSLAIGPWFEKVRNAPDFQALIAEVEAAAQPAPGIAGSRK